MKRYSSAPNPLPSSHSSSSSPCRRKSEQTSTKMSRTPAAPRAKPSPADPSRGRDSASRRPAASTSNPSISPRSSSRACRDPAGGPAAWAPSASRCRRLSRGGAARRGSASMRTSGSPGPTCTFGTTRTSRTWPPKGASTEVSIFMASSTSSGCPASTSSPGCTATDTTIAGAGATTSPWESRVKVWGTPSTSTRWERPWTSDSTRQVEPPHSRRHSEVWSRRSRSGEPSRSTPTSTRCPSSSTR